MSEPSSLVMQAVADPSFIGRLRGGLHRALTRWANRLQMQAQLLHRNRTGRMQVGIRL